MKLRVFRLGFDWLTYNFCADFSDADFISFFAGLSETSNRKFGVEFFGRTFDILMSDGKGRRSLYFDYSGDTVFCLTAINDEHRMKKVSYTFTFYGAFFYIPDLESILLEFTKKYRPYISLSRLDLALDCNVPVPELWKWKHTQFKRKRRYDYSDDLETFYLGQRKHNRKHLIRVYNKKADTLTKQKFHLFLPYFSEPVVTRIEVEMRILTLQALDITPNRIIAYERAKFDGEGNGVEIFEQYFSALCLDEEGTCFYPLKGLNFAKIETLNTTIHTGQAEVIIDKMAYVKQFITRGLRLQQMKADPIAILKRHLPPSPPSPLNGTGSNQITAFPHAYDES